MDSLAKFVGLVIIGLILGMILGSLTAEAQPAEPPYSRQEISTAKVFITRVEHLSFEEMLETCGSVFLKGCTFPVMGVIYLSSSLEEPERTKIFYHELAHIYEALVLGLSVRESGNHEGWRNP